MMSITSKNLEDTIVKYEDVVYIGMTNSQGGLISRWNQFHNSINGKNGHSGGITVFKRLGHYKKWNKRLFVCYMPVRCNVFKDSRTPSDLKKMGRIAYLEYEALAQYKIKLRKEPEFNKK